VKQYLNNTNTIDNNNDNNSQRTLLSVVGLPVVARCQLHGAGLSNLSLNTNEKTVTERQLDECEGVSPNK